jgi:hypothetical protein
MSGAGLRIQLFLIAYTPLALIFAVRAIPECRDGHLSSWLLLVIFVALTVAGLGMTLRMLHSSKDVSAVDITPKRGPGRRGPRRRIPRDLPVPVHPLQADVMADVGRLRHLHGGARPGDHSLKPDLGQPHLIPPTPPGCPRRLRHPSRCRPTRPTDSDPDLQAAGQM